MTATDTVLLVCSPRPRPQVHTGRTGGNAWWKRDVFHAAEGGKTLCGIDAAGWVEIEPRNVIDAMRDSNLCERCALAIHKQIPG